MVKKQIVLLISILIISGIMYPNVQHISATSLEDKILTYTFDFESLKLSQIRRDNQIMDIIRMNNTELIRSEGKPVIPIKPIKIMLPYQTTLDEIDIQITKTRSLFSNLANIELGSTAQSFDENLLPTLQTILPQFDQNAYFPENTYENLGIQHLHGCSILYLNIYPVQILQTQNLIRTHKNIELTITLKTSESSESFSLNQQKIQTITPMVINPDVIESYSQKTTSFYHDDNPTIDYLLITPEALKNLSDPQEYTFDDLITKRESQGLTCDIVTIEEIHRI